MPRLAPPPSPVSAVGQAMHTNTPSTGSPLGRIPSCPASIRGAGWSPGRKQLPSAAPDSQWRVAENSFCHPPWDLLDDLVLKLQRSGAAATVVAPLWHNRSWHQLLTEMVSEIKVYPPSPAELYQHRSVREYTLGSGQQGGASWSSVFHAGLGASPRLPGMAAASASLLAYICVTIGAYRHASAPVTARHTLFCHHDRRFGTIRVSSLSARGLAGRGLIILWGRWPRSLFCSAMVPPLLVPI